MILLIVYDYDPDYFGFPVFGMLRFAVVAVSPGIIADLTYEKTCCIWLPFLFHGAFNAAATTTNAVCTPGTGSARLLGPAPNGLLAGIPLFAAALILILRWNGPVENRRIRFRLEFSDELEAEHENISEDNTAYNGIMCYLCYIL